MELTTFDKDLLNLLQGSLPVCSRPFAALAEKLGTTEEAVIDRLQVLKEEGYLRRVAKAINRYPGATHNYEREGRYNLWFTLLTPGLDKEHEILTEIRALPGVESMLNLKSQKKYKINVQFKLA